MPFLTGAAQCRHCQVEIPWNKWQLCAFCQRDCLCWKCGAAVEEYRGDELCLQCYAITPFRYKLVKKGRTSWNNGKVN